MELELHRAYDRKVVEKPKLTVVMIHGIASDSTTYNALLEVLEQREDLNECRIVTFDLLGSGKSSSDDSLEYTYKEQLEALHNGIKHLELDSPLMLLGHSLGTFIVTRYVNTYPNEASELVLVSPPIYLPEDYDNPLFAVGMKAFEKSVSAKQKDILQNKAFRKSMDNIIMDRNNYNVLAGTKTPTTIIYGDEDKIIASHNIPRLKKDNPEIKVVAVHGKHGVSSDKFEEIFTVFKEAMKNEPAQKTGKAISKTKGKQ
ncbi:alpha/beta hydrolase [Candidatus Saccharibacteria bacterium]|nr:alpha/beta hydrolase [Candidatus Saccharibacteria bacterium]